MNSERHGESGSPIDVIERSPLPRGAPNCSYKNYLNGRIQWVLFTSLLNMDGLDYSNYKMDQELALRANKSALATYTGFSTAKSSIDLAGHRVAIYPLSNGGYTGEDFNYLKSIFSVLLGGLSEPDMGKVLALAKILVDDGWSTERLTLTKARFMRTFEAYGSTWTPAKFLECSPEADLHDHKWAEKENNDHPGEGRWKMMEGFRFKSTTLWRYKSDIPLPPEFEKVYPPSNKNWKNGKQRG